MSSTFVEHHTSTLLSPAIVPAELPDSLIPATREINLETLFLSLKPPLSPSQTRNALEALISNAQLNLASRALQKRELIFAIAYKIVVGLYAEALKTYLTEARDVDTEAEWWTDIENSKANVALYFLQTLPIRIRDVFDTIVHALRTRGFPHRLSAFMPSALRQLFPSISTLRPNVLTTALFPHLQLQPLTPFSFSALRILTYPLELTRQECRTKKLELERIRDQRAAVLGVLASMRDIIANVATQQTGQRDRPLLLIVDQMHRIIVTESPAESPSPTLPDTDVLRAIQLLANVTLPTHNSKHKLHMHTQRLYRPSPLILLWPHLLLVPPTVLYFISTLYSSRATLFEMATEAKETGKAFVRGWLLEPMWEVLKTVRTGGDEGVIIRKEGIIADFDSLERMTLALAQDKLHYGREQLLSLSQQIRAGDLTPVLQIYEEDIKRPLKSMVTGTLLRSMFVQVQKAKVDIDQALSGIDKLLKSQELTFAFVGVAPAFAVVYVIANYLKSFWSSRKGRGRYGGKKQRSNVWGAIRKIERLLVFRPRSPLINNSTITPLTSGLLLLSVMRLRSYAETHLPANSRLREGFLEDVEDLEDPGLGREEKLRVVERMWRCWGGVLGWQSEGSDSGGSR